MMCIRSFDNDPDILGLKAWQLIKWCSLVYFKNTLKIKNSQRYPLFVEPNEKSFAKKLTYILYLV